MAWYFIFYAFSTSVKVKCPVKGGGNSVNRRRVVWSRDGRRVENTRKKNSKVDRKLEIRNLIPGLYWTKLWISHNVFRSSHQKTLNLSSKVPPNFLNTSDFPIENLWISSRKSPWFLEKSQNFRSKTPEFPVGLEFTEKSILPHWKLKLHEFSVENTGISC